MLNYAERKANIHRGSTGTEELEEVVHVAVYELRHSTGWCQCMCFTGDTTFFGLLSSTKSFDLT